jgi:hypothetical protein
LLGVPGAGTSAVLAQVARAAAAEGWTVLGVTGHQSDRALPFAALVDLLTTACRRYDDNSQAVLGRRQRDGRVTGVPRAGRRGAALPPARGGHSVVDLPPLEVAETVVLLSRAGLDLEPA